MSLIPWIALPHGLTLKKQETSGGKWFYVVHPDLEFGERGAAIAELPAIVRIHMDACARRFPSGWGSREGRNRRPSSDP